MSKKVVISPEYQISTLDQAPELLQNTIDLIEKEFDYPKAHHFAIDFYPLLESDNHSNNYILISTQTNKVVGHIGVLHRTLQSKQSSMAISMLGGICISSALHGRGLLRLLMTHVLNTNNSKSAMFILWSDKLELYAKFGFHPAGIQIPCGKTAFPSSGADGFLPIPLSRLTACELEQIESIYQQSISAQYSTLERTRKVWNTYQHITSANLYLKKDHSGKIVSYFFCGKGGDLSNIIHELAYLPTYHDEITTTLSPYTQWVTPTNPNNTVNKETIFLALFALGNMASFNDFFHGWSEESSTISRMPSGQLELCYQNSRLIISTEKFVQLIWGPNTPTEFSEYFSPIFISGMDSI
ncbi:MAG: GNAT family N-acetyltransferase [Bdellovibrionales bacterium]|nr:GNAT family N-acetyltransferase [Bdellovibrionales bacterium]MBT3527092.1 GNAT family N-acetyltransferase [Bdellovibrionales bacterium]MBT7767918.1 GNAT family N-acetyltransferase [Bdellovibrionales bacterium]